MSERVRWFAEGGRAGVLLRPRGRWKVLARFHGLESERMARTLAHLIESKGLLSGAELVEPSEPPAS